MLFGSVPKASGFVITDVWNRLLSGLTMDLPVLYNAYFYKLFSQ